VIWQVWNDSDWTGNSAYTVARVEQWQESPEERARRERVHAEAQARAEERRLERHRARARAEELLLSLLDPEQKQSYKERHFFNVISNLGRLFRIHCNGDRYAGNITFFADDLRTPAASLCCHPPDMSLPAPDHWLAQKLALETDEEEFCRRANISSLIPGGVNFVRPQAVGRRTQLADAIVREAREARVA
jgi:hypothetical protein